MVQSLAAWPCPATPAFVTYTHDWLQDLPPSGVKPMELQIHFEKPTLAGALAMTVAHLTDQSLLEKGPFLRYISTLPQDFSEV